MDLNFIEKIQEQILVFTANLMDEFIKQDDQIPENIDDW
jgi:hypothetical protein